MHTGLCFFMSTFCIESISFVTICFQLFCVVVIISLSNIPSPLSPLFTFIVLPFLPNLKLQGLHEILIPFGLISISLLNCNLH